MKRLSGRQRVLGGALLVAALIGAVDLFSGARAPAEVQARPMSTGTGSTALPAWQDVSALVARLTRTEYIPVAGELEQLRRDLFMPTPLFEAAVVRPAPPESDEPAEAGQDRAPEPDFRDCHKLLGVITGSTRLAVVDDRLLGLNSDLDGYTLIEVHRDYVVFRQPGTEDRIRLELERGPRNPQPAAP